MVRSADLFINPIKTFIEFYKKILFLPNPSKTFFFGFFGLLIGWWVYVPVHELMHAAGCVLGGGEVHCLEIDSLYGGALFFDIFSFVSAESEYAGRLSGFDTHGSDGVYALTIVFPFVLTLFGFLLLEMGVQKRSPFVFMFFTPWAFAPIISLFGDYFELGSLLLFQVWPGTNEIHRLLISDDLFRLLSDISSGALDVIFGLPGTLFIGAAFICGAALAWGTVVLSEGFRALFRAMIMVYPKPPPL